MAKKSIPDPNDGAGSLRSQNSAKKAALHYEQSKIAWRLVDLGYEDMLKGWTFNHRDPRVAKMLQVLSDLEQEFPTQKSGFRKPKSNK